MIGGGIEVVAGVCVLSGKHKSMEINCRDCLGICDLSINFVDPLRPATASVSGRDAPLPVDKIEILR